MDIILSFELTQRDVIFRVQSASLAHLASPEATATKVTWVDKVQRDRKDSKEPVVKLADL